MTANDLALDLRGLTKTYGRAAAAKHALKGIDLAVPRGGFFGLLGPNGAGKSTLINILAGLVNKTAGTAKVWGHDLDTDTKAARRALGVVPQEIVIDPFFTPREALEWQAGYYGVAKADRRTDAVLDALGLGDKRDAYARSLSGGMKRRLMVAKALVHRPPILILDEPTAGVDVELRQQLWAYVRQLNADGTTVILTTHYLEEAEELCDRIAIIDHGAVIALDTTANLVRQIDEKELLLTLDRPANALPEDLKACATPTDPPLAPNQVCLRYRPSAADAGTLLAKFQAAGIGITDITSREPDLEDVFLGLTRRADGRG